MQVTKSSQARTSSDHGDGRRGLRRRPHRRFRSLPLFRNGPTLAHSWVKDDVTQPQRSRQPSRGISARRPARISWTLSIVFATGGRLRSACSYRWCCKLHPAARQAPVRISRICIMSRVSEHVRRRLFDFGSPSPYPLEHIIRIMGRSRIDARNCRVQVCEIRQAILKVVFNRFVDDEGTRVPCKAGEAVQVFSIAL